MSKSTKLIRRQAAVLEDLFAGALDEQEVLERHHVSPRLFERWLGDERFAELLEKRITRAHRRSHLILARYAPTAATKLVQLTDSENQETARKTCLDIISLDAPGAQPGSANTAPDPEGPPSTHALSPETASRLLAALARAELQVAGDSV